VLISDTIDEIPQTTGINAKRIWKRAAIIKYLILDAMSTISGWLLVSG